MTTVRDALLRELKNLSKAKQENFGSIPDEYRDVNENILADSSAAGYMLVEQSTAATRFPDFLDSLKELNLVKMLDTGDEDVSGIAIKLDANKIDMGKIIRKNWKLFEPAFKFLYLGIKIGEQRARDEQAALQSIARAEAREERRKLNPSAFESLAPEVPQVFLPAVSDTAELPAISPEKAEAFREEYERALKESDKKDN